MIKCSITMRSTALEMDTKVTVLLPEDRHKTEDLRGKKYPVLYVLHGGKNDCDSYLHLSNLFLLARDLDLIIVMPSVTNSFYTNQVYGFDYFTYVTEELPMKLRNYFPISEKREDAYIIGESMGGYGTMRCALARPDLYNKAVCFSAGNFVDMYNPNNKLHVADFGTKEEMVASDNNLLNLIERLKNYKGDKPEFAFYCGTEDFAYPGCTALAKALKETCPDVKVREEYWNGEHNFFFWNQALPKALKFFGFEVKQNSVI